ncbi:MAG TPA: hypothetical protein VEC13_01000 [Candidatus Paceibacterota bacterium]|nr:hypothetical protein [Candidatus Paceibacterota bacterium]
MKNTTKYLLIALVILGIFSLFFNYMYKRSQTGVPAVTVPALENPSLEPVLRSEGSATVKLLERAEFKEISILPRKVAEDSRCPSDVNCVWAGQTKVEADITTLKGLTVHTFLNNESFMIEGYKVTLEKVEPYPKTPGKIAESDYRFTFKVEKAAAVAAGKCYVGGCSSQICSDTPGVASTCEYKEVYACYQGATCERQSDGKCGWTQTGALRKCIFEKDPPVMDVNNAA